MCFRKIPVLHANRMSAICLRAATRRAVLPLSSTCLSTAKYPSLTRLPSVRHHSTPPASSGASSSVSADEVSHFTGLASSWWDPHGPSRLLHLMNPLRHDFIRSCVNSTPAGSALELGNGGKYTYLDIGCGGGIFASSAARLPSTASVTAIDPTPEVIKVAKLHQRSDPLLSESGRLQYLNCAIEDLDAHTTKESGRNTSQYDFVTVFEVIEHISKPSAFLRVALSHLKPGGWLIGSTIARHPLSYLTTKIVAEAPWPIGVVPAGTHDWDKYINPTEISGWFTKESTPRHVKKVDNITVDKPSEQGVEAVAKFGEVKIEGCIYLPILGWKFVNGSQDYGNYFFGVQKLS